MGSACTTSALVHSCQGLLDHCVRADPLRFAFEVQDNSVAEGAVRHPPYVVSGNGGSTFGQGEDLAAEGQGLCRAGAGSVAHELTSERYRVRRVRARDVDQLRDPAPHPLPQRNLAGEGLHLQDALSIHDR